MQENQYSEWKNSICAAEEEAQRTRLLADLSPNRCAQGILEELAVHLEQRAGVLRGRWREWGGKGWENIRKPMAVENYRTGLWRQIPAEWRQCAVLCRFLEKESEEIWRRKLYALVQEVQQDLLIRLFLLEDAADTGEEYRRPRAF